MIEESEPLAKPRSESQGPSPRPGGLLETLEARQDELLKQLDELNRQLEAALKQYSKAPVTEAAPAKKAA